MTSQKTAKAFKDLKELPAATTNDQKQNMEEVAYTALLLNISDNVHWQVIEESIAHEVWKKQHL